MKRLVVIYSLLALSAIVTSQRHYITNLYAYDLFLINPASAGADKNSYDFGAYYQNQWLGMDKSPTTQMFNFQGPASQYLGMGSYIYNDRNGNVNQFGLHQAMSYEFVLSKQRRRLVTMSFGLAMSVEQVRIDEGGFNTPSGILDPAINGGVNSGWGVNSSSGMLLKYNDYHFGFSVTNMMGQTNQLYLNDGEPNLPMDYHFYASSMYKVVDRDVYLEPLMMYRHNSNDDQRLDFSLKATFPSPNPEYALWGLVSYRRNLDHQLGKSLGFGTTVGVNYRRLSFGVEYQLGLTGAQLDYGSSYKLVTRYNISNHLKNRAIPCTEARKNKRSRYSGLSW